MFSQSNSPAASASTEDQYLDATEFAYPSSLDNLLTPPTTQQSTGQAETSRGLYREKSDVKEEEENEDEEDEEDKEEDEEQGEEEEDEDEEEEEEEEEVEVEVEVEAMDELEEDAPVVAARRSARLGAKVAKPSTNHPSYHTMIANAIKSNKGALGATRTFIKTFIHKQYSIDYNSIEASFNDAVKSGRKRSIFTFTNSNSTRLALVKKARVVKVSNFAKAPAARSVTKPQQKRATAPATDAHKARPASAAKSSAKKSSAKSTRIARVQKMGKVASTTTSKAASRTASKTATPISRASERSSTKRKSDDVDELESEAETETTSRILISRATQTTTRPASNRPFPKKIRKTPVKTN
ncbi:hypothetical protein BGZ68_003426 [Mortierella alpina]|nr:hypothetical protein BGZ68_003426 [Mortierella alpina]